MAVGARLVPHAQYVYTSDVVPYIRRCTELGVAVCAFVQISHLFASKTGVVYGSHNPVVTVVTAE